MMSILAAAAAAFAVSAPSASAAEAVALPYCWGAVYGGNAAQICAENTSWIGGTVVDPGLRTDCIIKTDAVATMALSSNIAIPPVRPCTIVGTVVSGVDDTGLSQVGQGYPYYYNGSVRMGTATWATVLVDGASYRVVTDDLCVGGGCPTGVASLINLVQVVS